MQPPRAIINKRFNEDVTVRSVSAQAADSDEDGLLSDPDRKS